jgi:Uma2 family endonuclease
MSTIPNFSATDPQPVWDVATLYPPQGGWSEEDYLSLTDSTSRLIEFTDGQVEFLAMPTEAHQLILAFLFEALRDFVRGKELGLVLFAGLRVQLRPGMIREPDLVFISKDNFRHRGSRYWTGADLVMEVVSPDDASRRRDLEQKVAEYADAGIREYWIVDPKEETIQVLTLAPETHSFTKSGNYAAGQSATSKQLPGFALDVKRVFDAARV